MKTTHYHSPIGILRIIGDEKSVRSICFVEEEDKKKSDEPTGVMLECMKQLSEYFKGVRRTFDFYYVYVGTDFQRKVWQHLEKIPYGSTTSCKNIALDLGSEKLMRPVGLANEKNPMSIVVPCHRVVGSSGKLGGDTGELWRKQWLLIHEQKHNGKTSRLFV